ncbi:MAG: CHAT domain-containing protein [Phormidesmis sp.]
MIQEFEISITAVGGDQYLVRTENVAKGVQLAEEKVRWPVAEWLKQTKELMHDPLLGLLQGQTRHTLPTRAGQPGRRSQSDEAAIATLVNLGQTLHDKLFQGQLHDSWVTAQGVAQNRQQWLRLRIGMKDNRLQQLPWEALHAGTRPLATGTDVIFSRYILDRRQGHSLQPTKASDSGSHLRILMVIASPDDQERLELKQEVYHLRSELHPEGADDDGALLDVQLKILEQPGRAELTQELERGNYQVLHYAGHSNLGNEGGDLYLVSRQTGLTERLSGEDLAGLLVNTGIKLAVFNSCRGAYSAGTEAGWQERNLAQALVNRGVPGVIAMTERIPDHVAITFTQLLYRNLKKGQSIDLSLNRTRQGLISAYGSHQFYWALPTLYMQPSFDGYLVKMAGDAASEKIRDRANPRLADSANDPFGGMFAEPGLADIDLPGPRKKSVASPATEAIAPNRPHTASLDYQNLIENSDAAATDAMVKQLSTPLIPIEVDGELRLPEAIETPTGFYGESAPTMPARPAADKLQQTQAKTPTPPTANAATAKTNTRSAVPELVGERLTRSHTLHTKFSTASGLALIAVVALLGGMSAIWLQRSFQSRSAAPTAISAAPNGTDNANRAELPAQVELALARGDLDEAADATKALIDNNQFEEALSALSVGNGAQQRDVIVSFFRGRAQWGLVKQGNEDFAASDAMRSWATALESESDWMEIVMALGFSQYAIGRKDLALESFQDAINLAEKQPDAKYIYFSQKPTAEYALNAQAGLALSALALSEIESDPVEQERLIDQASRAYLTVMNEAPTDFDVNSLGNNWLWLEDTIRDWEAAKRELGQNANRK